jgi:Protein of unknown function (DUF3891)
VRRGGRAIPAWQAVFDTQQHAAAGCWMIAQPDHAALAGDLAQEFAQPPYPPLDEVIVRAIRLHDSGWAEMDGGGERGTGLPSPLGTPSPKHHSDGRPLSFLEIGPSDFLAAWSRSIQRAAEASGPLGGLLVRGHFCRLGQARLEGAKDPPGEVRLIRDFLTREESRQTGWLAALRGLRTPEQVEMLTDLLQFCDLLSLYLCCGSADEVVFPQTFGEGRPTLRQHGAAFVLAPSPFNRAVKVAVEAKRHGSHQTKDFEFEVR